MEPMLWKSFSSRLSMSYFRKIAFFCNFFKAQFTVSALKTILSFVHANFKIRTSSGNDDQFLSDLSQWLSGTDSCTLWFNPSNHNKKWLSINFSSFFFRDTLTTNMKSPNEWIIAMHIVTQLETIERLKQKNGTFNNCTVHYLVDSIIPIHR